MADVTQKAPVNGLGNVVKLVVRTFLEDSHYSELSKILSEEWKECHSLTAAVKLMEAHGMQVTPEEEKRLLELPDEETMINELVKRMPQQSREQFEHFFLQLSFIAATSGRLRSAMEVGNAEQIEEALESAENVGVLTYLLKMVVAQSGKEVKECEVDHDDWLGKTDQRLQPLMQAQFLSLAVQKELTQAQVALEDFSNTAKESAAAMLTRLANIADQTLLANSLRGWRDFAHQQKKERELRADYQAQIDEARKKLSDMKKAQKSAVSGILSRAFKEQETKTADNVLSHLREAAASGKLERAAASETKELEDKLNTYTARATEKATSVLTSFAASADRELLELTLRYWKSHLADVKKDKENVDALKAMEVKIFNFTKTASAGAQAVMLKIAKENDVVMLETVLLSWAEEAKLQQILKKDEEALDVHKGHLQEFCARNGASATKIQERTGGAYDDQLLILCFSTWKRETRVARVVRWGKERNARRKQELLGVKGLFKTFATDLESSLKDGTPRVEVLPRRGRATGPVA